MSVIRTQDNTVTATIILPYSSPSDVVFSPDGSKAYVTFLL
ncbi:hypothetical protein LLH32_08605 [Bacillus nakamurai]|nr:hypothetical protein [Bacillus nakamurai]